MNILTFGYEQWVPQLPMVLRERGMNPLEVMDAEDALSILSLDYELDGVVCGIEYLRDSFPKKMRRQSDLPLIVLVPRSDSDIRIQLLNEGADCVLPLPVNKFELQAYILACIRRSQGVSANTITVGCLELDLHTRQVTLGGEDVRLRNTEYAILETLILRKGKVVSVANFMERMYPNHEDPPDPKIISVNICNMKRAYPMFRDLIHNDWGNGYFIKEET